MRPNTEDDCMKTRPSRFTVSLGVTMLLLFSQSAEGVRSSAGVNTNLSKADVVLIGTVSGPSKSQDGTLVVNGVKVVGHFVESPIAVEAVLRGKTEKEIRIKSFRPVAPPRNFVFASLLEHQRYLICLSRRGPGETVWSLVNHEDGAVMLAPKTKNEVGLVTLRAVVEHEFMKLAESGEGSDLVGGLWLLRELGWLSPAVRCRFCKIVDGVPPRERPLALSVALELGIGNSCGSPAVDYVAEAGREGLKQSIQEYERSRAAQRTARLIGETGVRAPFTDELSKPLVPHLVESLGSPSLSIRFVAVRALAQIVGRSGEWDPSWEYFQSSEGSASRDWKNWWLEGAPEN